MRSPQTQAWTRFHSIFLASILGAGGLFCAAPPPAPASPASGLSDEKAILKQELGELPAPTGPCPERTEPNVLGNPRAPVQRTALGLAYCLLHEGPPGSVPGAEDTVRVHYTGWTTEGEMFDSSVERGEPMDLPLSGVIRGWTEGLRLMTPGDKARLWIPGNLGYGRREAGEDAGKPPKGTLIFDIELIEVVRAPEAEEPASVTEAAPRPGLAPRPLPPAAETRPKRN
jgi:peptidylprolyl isomerase